MTKICCIDKNKDNNNKNIADNKTKKKKKNPIENARKQEKKNEAEENCKFARRVLKIC